MKRGGLRAAGLFGLTWLAAPVAMATDSAACGWLGSQAIEVATQMREGVPKEALLREQTPDNVPYNAMVHFVFEFEQSDAPATDIGGRAQDRCCQGYFGI